MDWQLLIGYGTIWIVGLVFCSFVASFAWFNLKSQQARRNRARMDAV